MSKLLLSALLGLVVSCCLLTGDLLGQSGDRVYPKSGRAKSGNVIRMSTRNVILDDSGTESRFDVNEIKQIVFAGEPRELTRARTSINEGRFNNALQELTSIDEPPSREVIALDVEFFKSLCQAQLAIQGEQGTLNGAGATVAKLVQTLQQKENYHYYDAVRLFGNLAMASGNFAAAEREYTKIAEAPWPDVELEGRLLVAQSKLGQKKYAAAFEDFTFVESSSIKSLEAAELKLAAKIGSAACMGGLGRADEGIAALEDLLLAQRDENGPLLAKLYNAIGHCHVEANRPKDALLAFLHVDLLFQQDRMAHAEALYHISELFAQLKQDDRARDAMRKLQSQRFVNCYWASLQ